MSKPKLQYGTAGFRYPEDIIIKYVAPKLLSAIIYLTFVFRSPNLSSSIRPVKGIMITASHNSYEYNGVKLVSDDGTMLSLEQEQCLEDLINYDDKEYYLKLSNMQKIEKSTIKPLTLIVAHDTRPSANEIIKILETSRMQIMHTDCKIGSLVKIINIGLRTTPELHYYTAQPLTENFDETYVNNITTLNCYNSIIDQIKNTTNIDCANGIASVVLPKFSNSLSLINSDTINPKLLNYECGAAYVATNPGSNHYSKLTFCLDGDADRLVLVTKDNQLINGDKIACILCKHIIDNYKNLLDDCKLGYIYTAYTNGAAVNYAASLGFEKCCVNTGIKNLCAATINYDVAVYFETNGHGSIHFSDKAKKIFKNTTNGDILMKLSNPYIGDGIYLIFLLAFVTLIDKASFEELVNVYSELPYYNSAYEITTNTLRLIDTQIQTNLINQASELGVRLHIRKSGTEPLIRIYVEGYEYYKILKILDEIIIAP